MIEKKDGGYQICIDYRGVNSITQADATPLPSHVQIRKVLQGSKYFSKIDIRDAFHQIRIDEGSIHKTAFQTRYGLFEFIVSAFGLKNSPAVFMKFMNAKFFDLVDSIVIFYMDDIIIFSKD